MVAAPPPASDRPPGAPLAPALAAGLVFLASGAVLVLEILGVRLLAPYVGLTLETTTSIIGAVLAGIALGTAVGGRAADLVDPRRMLTWLFVGGGVLALLTVPIVRALGSAVREGGDVGALFVTLVALLPPAAALSAVTPAVARLQLRDLDAAGTVFGRFSAWATGGALVGTFGTGFVLIGLVPVSAAVVGTGSLLVLAGVALGVRGSSAAAVLLVVPACAFLTAAAGRPCDVETTYHCARVEEDSARTGGRILILDDLRHSYVDLADPLHLEFDYVRWIGDAIDGMRAPGAAVDALFVGGGGFTLPRYLAASRPGSASRVLEVDGDLVELARRRLGLRTSSSLRVEVGDARVTMRGASTASADLVVGDAFSSRAVPWHLATAEWLTEVRRVLRPRGVYALNLIDQKPLGLLRAEAATLLEAFADVRLVAPPGPAGGNVVLLASESPLPPGVRSTARGARTFERAEVTRLTRGAEPLTDDRAPVDQLLSR